MPPLQYEGAPLDIARTAQAQDLIERHKRNIRYSEKYTNEASTTEYRHVILPKELKKLIPKKLMNEAEWRSLGVQQSYGWVHYMLHAPELHVLCFKRELGTAMIP